MSRDPLRTPYSTVRRVPRVRTVNDEPSMTVQSDRNRSEIKQILAKYAETGVVDHMRNVDLQFRDVSEFEDFADLMLQTKVAEQEFLKLPSKLREVFDHDVMTWLDCAHDPEKLEALRPQLEELGVMKPLPDPDPEPPIPPADADPPEPTT